MKHITTIEKFIELAHIKNYKDDLYDDVTYEYERMSNDEIHRALPAKYSKFMFEKLKLLPTLRDSLEHALNRANESALIGECYKRQNDELEAYADRLVKLVNDVSEGKTEALNSIVIDWEKDEVTIDFNTGVALSTTREIINGEGMFVYDSDSELAMINDGKYKPAQAVIDHLHYLLNGKLINDIFGISSYRWGELQWECDYGYPTEKDIESELKEECNDVQLEFLQGKIDGNLLYAVELKTQQTNAKKLASEATKKLNSTLSSLSTDDKKKYETLIK